MSRLFYERIDQLKWAVTFYSLIKAIGAAFSIFVRGGETARADPVSTKSMSHDQMITLKAVPPFQTPTSCHGFEAAFL
ncbi:hypothetical protein TNCV_634031 [Trichonephila clavipes]|nr:hypothetical protein TNCV_634031 [Trichonephila clavipes]